MINSQDMVGSQDAHNCLVWFLRQAELKSLRKNCRLLLYQFDTDYVPSLLRDEDYVKDAVVASSTSVPTQTEGKYAFDSSEVWGIL